MATHETTKIHLNERIRQDSITHDNEINDLREHHREREVELSNHADSMSRELEQLRKDVANRPSTDGELQRELEHLKTLRDSDRELIAMLKSQVTSLERTAGNATVQNTLLIKQAASSNTRSQGCASHHSAVSRRTEEHYMGDDEEGEWDDEQDAGWYNGDWHPQGGVSSLTLTGTQTQTQTMAAAGSGGAGGGNNGRPPRPNSADGAPSAAGSADRRDEDKRTPSGGGGGDLIRGMTLSGRFSRAKARTAR